MKKYEFQRMLADFQARELAAGAELVLASPQNWNCEETEEGLKLRGDFDNTSSRFQKYQATVVLDRKQGILIRTNCNCQEYQRSFYCCPHIAGLLVLFLMEEEGREILAGSPVEEELIQRTGIQTPLVPGILRKSDQALKGLLQRKKTVAKNQKPSWLSEETFQKTNIAPDILTVDYSLRNEGKSLTLDLKSGLKRHVILHDLNQFLKCYQNHSVFSFSNTMKGLVGPEKFGKEDREILDFLCQIDGLYSKESLYSYDYYSSKADRYRYLILSGRDLDAFFQKMNGRTVLLDSYDSDSKSCRIDLEAKPSGIQMVKENFGASIRAGNQTPLACGMEHMYLLDGEMILARPREEWEKRKALCDALSEQEELYVAEQDLPVICQNLLELDDAENEITTVGFALSDYLREVPAISLYLDYPQEGMISCELQAFYPRLAKNFRLLDQKQGKTMRNLSAEQAVGEQVAQHFNAYDQKAKQLLYTCNEEDLYRFLTETLPKLSAYGEVLVSDRMKKLKVRPIGEVSVGLSVDSGSLLMSLHANGLSKLEMAEILSSYNGKRKFTRLKNGEFIKLPPESEQELWDTLAETYRAYGEKDPEMMKLPLFRALYLQESLADRDAISLEESDTYGTLIRQLQDDAEWDAPVPASLTDILRPYQKDGFLWTKMLKKHGFGGILADDMGLGKTLQILVFLLSEKEDTPDRKLKTLIVSPASLIYNWKKEIRTFTPDLACRVIAGTARERKLLISQIPDSEVEVYITSYDLLRRDFALYEGIHFDYQIIDEAQYIKNQSTQAAKAVRIIDSAFRMALTGTPIENRLSELWSIFDYLMPGFLYSYSRFRSDFETPVIMEHDEDVMNRLRRMVHPFILRRLKSDVLAELPDKIQETVSVQLEGEQRKLYDAYAERLRLYLDKQSDEEFHQSKLEILAELTRLRQICCGPDLFLEKYKGENAKKDACMELVHRAIEGGHKILLFSQFTSVLNELGNALKEDHIAYHRIDGSVRKEDRMKMVDSFAEDDVPVFCISLKAGGTGLNLTAADIVIHYDPWWNLAAQNQATDRAHRIGQENTVTVYQLIAEDTIEEQITKIQQTKAQLAQDILEGEGIASIMIRKEDLLELL